ncbi:hypothetical protein Syun_030666 [Stephania yunnanensis]|uniref:Uncharacterized protein n=1 Tax=Stephania yunnanensis TaxID=152371 RepID=A0AAP0DXT4_9MAGN
MARHGCINGTLDDSSYSSPIPIIGLYIAAATLEKSIDEIEEFLHLIHETEQGLEEWTLRKGVRDMKKWTELNRNNPAILNIKRLLSKACALPDPLINQLKDFRNRIKAYERIFEVIHFVERKMSCTSFENKKKSKFAKAASQGPSNRVDLLEIFGISNTEVLQTNYDIDQAMAVVRRLKDALPSDLVREELGILTSFIQQQSCRSVEELHDYIEQLFVEMLNELLIQLPNAIYKEIIECNPEDYEKVIRFSLKLLCKVESLEAFVQWSYPIGTNINDLITNSSDGE